MAKYSSPITAKLTTENWREKINLKTMAISDMINLAGDMKKMEALGKAVRGYMKEVIEARLPEGETTYDTGRWTATFTDGTRKGSLDEARILEDMGEQFVEKYRKDTTEFVILKLTEAK